ncbi:MAG TPA: hypothetical protein VLF93_06760 [Candidatus Saccharimonadales bacterium]|nr:hypothetical protein [Candidatus Saccharimonadales bacterium]
MKPQDILFIIILIGLLFLRKPRVFIWAAMLCLFVSMPLFYKYVFFTAERLVMYAAGFFFVAIILFWIRMRK